MKVLVEISFTNVKKCGGNSVVECLLAKEDVASSSLVSRSIKKSPSTDSFLLRFSLIEISEILAIFYPKGTIRGLFRKFVDFTSFE